MGLIDGMFGMDEGELDDLPYPKELIENADPIMLRLRWWLDKASGRFRADSSAADESGEGGGEGYNEPTS